jgi:hypothetical protein
MGSTTPIETLEEEERRARIRLAAYRASLYRRNGLSPMRAEMRLRERERQWKGAAERLRRARRANKG